MVLPSTLLLTLLLMVGLFFFIRASTKDRTELMEWVTEDAGESVLKSSRIPTKREILSNYRGQARPNLRLFL
ncbi:MAG: cofactor assembly of complex C subunit B [Acaryochloridaceae cyanobacterium RL_2_7]|nr:cofactor assembly of complex C subunit B [Acaryochloridaceae cyanobacterium RL_2_7]